jgi:hypothetical protein
MIDGVVEVVVTVNDRGADMAMPTRRRLDRAEVLT